VLRCAACAGPDPIIGFIQDERTARKILDHLHGPAIAPSPGGPRLRPGQQELWREPAGDGSSFDGIDPPSPE
jgi:hypothetical protein